MDVSAAWLYNRAAARFAVRRTDEARQLLVPLVAQFATVDSMLAWRACFLLLDVYLLQQRLPEALRLVYHLDGQLGTVPKAPAAKPPDGGADGATGSPDEIQHWARAVLGLYRIRLSLAMSAWRLLRRDFRTASAAGAPELPTAILRAQQEYQRGSYDKAERILLDLAPLSAAGRGAASADAGQLSVCWNNLACVASAQHKADTAIIYAMRAMQATHSSGTSDVPVPKAKPLDVPVASVPHDPRPMLLNNLGVLLLLSCGRERLAFECLARSLCHYRSNATTWLRLAEACIQHHAEQINARIAAWHSPCVAAMAPAVPSSAPVTLFGLARAPHEDPRLLHSLDLPVGMTLDAALRYLHNARALLVNQRAEPHVADPRTLFIAAVERASGTNPAAPSPSQASEAPASEPTSHLASWLAQMERERQTLQWHVDCLVAYVSLWLGDYIGACAAARRVPASQGSESLRFAVRACAVTRVATEGRSPDHRFTCDWVRTAYPSLPLPHHHYHHRHDHQHYSPSSLTPPLARRSPDCRHRSLTRRPSACWPHCTKRTHWPHWAGRLMHCSCWHRPMCNSSSAAWQPSTTQRARRR